jgi:hypothetical protein
MAHAYTFGSLRCNLGTGFTCKNAQGHEFTLKAYLPDGGYAREADQEVF